MAASQRWSDWAAGWFERKGKIFEIIATAEARLRSTAQKD
jgi:hypothetical protein